MDESPPAPRAAILSLAPGLGICLVLATASMLAAESSFVKDRLHLGALLLVILFGMACRTIIRLPESLRSGIDMAQKPLLRLAVAGLGFKLSIAELAKVGWPALVVVVGTTAVALFGCRALGRRFGLDAKFADLLAFGGGICGASAIVAADSVLESKRSEVACSLGIITLLGTIGIIVYPMVGRALSLSDFAYSVWNGASLHEMAQVVAAGQGFSDDAAQWSTVVKLARITLLAPAVFLVAFEVRRMQSRELKIRTPIVPWFLALFLAFVVLNSFIDLGKPLLDLINGKIVLFLLCVGMAGVGLNSGFQDIRAHGWRPIAVSSLQWIVLSALTLVLAMSIPRAF